MRTLILSLALIAFTFISCSDSQAPATSPDMAPSSKATVIKELPFSACPIQFCPDCDECVCISGTFQIVENGKTFHLLAKGSGFGVDCTTGEPTGTTYKWHDNINVTGNGGFNQSWHVTSNDGGCDFTLHVTVNANGELVVENIDCN